MILRTKIRPSKYRATTKDELISDIRRDFCGNWSFGSVGRHFSYSGMKADSVYNRESILIVYNAHKVRRKTIQKKGKDGKTKSKIVTKGHWIAFVYKFDLELLQKLGVKSIRQLQNNFEIKF